MKFTDLYTSDSNKLLILKNCESPIVIFNKAVIPFILKNSFIIIKDRIHYLTPNELNSLALEPNIPLRKFSHFRKQVQKNTNTILDYQVPDNDGHSLCIFNLVGCGKCLSCRNRKANDLQVRAICESITSRTRPISIVLTYKPEQLPVDGLSKEDVQKFLKRLRIELHRKYHSFGYKDDLRYFCVGEYGSKRQKPHYHLILWNLPKLADIDCFNLQQLKNFLESVWQKGFVLIKYTDEPLNPNSKASVKCGVQYCVKYLNKECNIPLRKVSYYDAYTDSIQTALEPLNKPFMLLSRGRGKCQGLGSQWLFDNADWIKNNLSSLSSYTWVYRNEKKTCSIPQYFIDKLWPTISRLVPKDIRDKFAVYNAFIPYLKVNCYETYYIENLKAKFWFLPQPVTYIDFNHNLEPFEDFNEIYSIIEDLNAYVVPQLITKDLLNSLADRRQAINLSFQDKDYMTSSSYKEYYDIFFSKQPKYNYIDDEQ